MQLQKFRLNATAQVTVKAEQVQCNTTYTDVGKPDRQFSVSAWPSVKYVENSTKPTCLEIAGYPIKYGTVLWLLELQIGRGQKV